MGTLNQRLDALERQKGARTWRERWTAWLGREITPATATEFLIAIADEAESDGSVGGLNVARQALMDAAKLNGLIVEMHESITRSPQERAARLAELRAERERLARTN